MFMKRILVIMLSLTLMLGMMACTNKAADGTKTNSENANSDIAEKASNEDDNLNDSANAEPTEISMMSWDISDSFSDDEPDKMRDYILDKFNITITPVSVGWDDYSEKGTIWAASDSLPDVIGAQALVGSAQYYQWIEDGIVRALPEDLSQYPNVMNNLQQPEVEAYAVDGNNYLLPRQTYANAEWWCMDRGILNRKDWREQLDIPVPKTEQDFIDMWLAYTANDMNGDGTTVYGVAPDSKTMLFSQTFPTYGYTDTRWVKSDDGNLVIPSMEESALPLMTFLRKAYAAGAFDPDFVSYVSGDGKENFATGKIGTLIQQVTPKHINAINEEWKKVQKDKDFVDCVEILRPPEVSDQIPIMFAEKPYWSETYINSSVDDDKMAKILEIYDYFYTEEGMRMQLYGFEDEDYKIEDDEIVLMTEVDPETDEQKTAGDLYRFAAGGMGSLVAWPGDYMQYEDPSIPSKLRDMCAAELDFRIENWEMPELDYRILAIDIPEKAEMSNIDIGDDWIQFVIDTSNTSDKDLFDQIYANWEANGYKAAKEAMTQKVAELGY